MLTTAKSFQLLDENGINISPVTDITSLYYEVERNSSMGKPIVARKYVYSGFPVAVNIDPDVCTYIGKTNDAQYIPSPDLYYKMVDASTQEDIIVSNISTSIIPGTTYRLFNIKNYNLSEILKSYTTREMFDASIGNIDTSILNLDTSILNLYNSLINESYKLENLLSMLLIPGKFYIINDYYINGGSSAPDGCMYKHSANFDGPDYSNRKMLLVKAFDDHTLDGKLYEMYDLDGLIKHVYGNYIIIEDDEHLRIKITYLKDSNCNEAPYDFVNLKYKYNNKFYLTFHDNYNNTCKNNVIKVNPYESNIMPIFIGNDESSVKNNYIGHNTSIILYTGKALKFENNIIKNNNSIYIVGDNHYSLSIDIQNMIMNNNNFFGTNTDEEIILNISYKNIYINNSNNIILPQNKLITNIDKLVVNTSNNINLLNDYVSNGLINVTILNNCNGSIKINSNVIIDNVQTDFITEENSVYLFGQNVYAGSFHTLK